MTRHGIVWQSNWVSGRRRRHKREEAQRKAKLEQERKLAQQKEESARAMDNIMEKTLSSIGASKKISATSSILLPVSPTTAGQQSSPVATNVLLLGNKTMTKSASLDFPISPKKTDYLIHNQNNNNK